MAENRSERDHKIDHGKFEDLETADELEQEYKFQKKVNKARKERVKKEKKNGEKNRNTGTL